MDKGQGELHNLLEQIDDGEDENELIEIQLQKSTIKVNFVNLLTYSKFIRDEYQNLTETKLRLSREFQTFQKKFNISDENTILFFSTFENKNFYINNNNYCDLGKLSNFFQVKRLIILLNQYKTNHNFDIDFIISQILKEIQNKIDDYYTVGGFNFDLESNLYKKVNECLKNERFELLPTSIVYRVLSKSEEEISSDLLFDFISKSIEERLTLLSFLNIQNLSNKKFGELFDLYDQHQFYFQYLPSNISFLKSIKDENKKIKDENKKIKEENKLIKDENKSIKDENKKIKDENKTVKDENKSIKDEIKSIKDENKKIKDENDSIKIKLNEMNDKCSKLQGSIDDIFNVLNFAGYREEEFFSEGIIYLNSCAEKGNNLALLCLGLFYYFFGNEEKDEKMKNNSESYFQKLHERGLFHELLIIGFIYEEQGNYSKAIEFYQQSAAKGNQAAILKLAYFYEEGKGFEKDYSEAVKLYRQLEKAGNSIALFRLSDLYIQGKGVEQNHSKAMEYLEQLEKRGNVLALKKLGEIYEEGNGVEKNLIKALNYYERINDSFHFQMMKVEIERIKNIQGDSDLVQKKDDSSESDSHVKSKKKVKKPKIKFTRATPE